MTTVAVLFWASILVVAYTFVGYPLVLWARAKLRPRRPPVCVADDSQLPPVTVVIVVYNEGARIGRKIENLLKSNYPADRLNVLIASDASDDDTAAVVRSYADRGVKLLEFSERRGKAACVTDAMAAVTTEFVVLNDARQRLDAGAIRQLVCVLWGDESIGAVSGELVFEDDSPTDFSRGVDIYWTYEKFIRNQEALIDSTVGVTGAIYAIRRSCFSPLPLGAILDDVMVPMRVVRAGRRVTFEPAAVAYDVPSRDPAAERRRKVRTLLGNWQLLAFESWLLLPWKNRIWWQFMSHKVLRLVAPLFIVLAFVQSVLLAGTSPFYRAMLLLQVGFYCAPLVGRVVPNRRLRSLFMAPMAFVYLNWFATRGFWEFLLKRKGHLWR
jgi:poly-beta-1,6-N-acetyl-D-glucosamine synthase